jgi:PLP dependent protein
MSIAENLAAIQARVQAACIAADRPVDAVRLVAVSKTKPVAAIQEALAAGQLVFGENYAQELRDKATQVEGVEWHFIGHLQRNKARYVAGTAALVHAVDTVKLARELAKRAPDGQDILLEVNIGEELSKAGVMPAEALARCQELAQLDGIRLRGLMTIPPQGEDSGRYFQMLADIAAEGRRQGLSLDELSMGMSADFETAIAHGATLVRVGSAIFGRRE